MPRSTSRSNVRGARERCASSWGRRLTVKVSAMAFLTDAAGAVPCPRHEIVINQAKRLEIGPLRRLMLLRHAKTETAP